MARSLSQSNRILPLLADALSFPLQRRGYAAGLDRIGSRSDMMGKVEEKSGDRNGSEASSAWAPDPVTGYYRPINRTNEIDPVELRRMFLNHKIRSSSP